MGGFSTITGGDDKGTVMFADNASFDGTQRAGALTTAGQLWIGTGSATVRKVKAGSITSSDNTITITYSDPNIVMVTNPLKVANTITGNNALPLSPIGANWNIITANSTPTFVGAGATLTLDFALTNLALGSSQTSITTATNNTAFGRSALNSLSTAAQAVAIGFQAMQNGNASFTTAVGSQALKAVTGSQNTGVGTTAGALLSTGTNNTFLGYASGGAVVTGTNNTLLGSNSGTSYTGAESNNILIGYNVTGTLGENNVTRIGGNQNSCYIDGITGVTVAASAPIAVDVNNQLSSLGFGTSGQVLTSNGNLVSPSWQSNSSTDYHVARYIVSAGGSADGANYTTIASAITAASAAGAPQTIFIQPGTYTENLTLVPQINLVSFVSESINSQFARAPTPNVTILGTVTITTAGQYNLAGICFKTNAATAFTTTGAGATVINCRDCLFWSANAVAYVQNNTNSLVTLRSCAFYQESTYAYFNGTLGSTVLYATTFINTGTPVNSTVDSGSYGFNNCNCSALAITTSSTGSVGSRNSTISFSGTTFLTMAGTGTSNISNCDILTGTASACSIGSGCTLNITSCSISSSNANALTGAGTINSAGINYISTSSTNNATTQVPLVASNDALKIVTPGAYPYTTTPQDAVILVDTSSARTITPLASPTTGQKHIIKDSVGSAAANNITVTPSGKNIDGAASYVMSTNYQSITIVYNGTEWNVI